MTEKDPAACFEATIRGRVQGVGFRYHTLRFAKERGVTGWVSNQTDGSVRVVAQGRPAELDAFISFLRVGPSHAEVVDVEMDYSQHGDDFTEFEIRA